MCNTFRSLMAARGYDRVWHWADCLGYTDARLYCHSNNIEWRRAVKPAADFKIVLEAGDTLCHECNSKCTWVGLITPPLQDPTSLDKSLLEAAQEFGAAQLDTTDPGLRYWRACDSLHRAVRAKIREERTADGVAVGRCCYPCPNDICPIHGNVRGAIDTYLRTGKLTDENYHVSHRRETNED